MWKGEGGFQAPAVEELIAKALRLWRKYTVRGQQIPRTEITAIRQLLPAYDHAASKEFKRSLSNYKRELRQEIGQRALSGKFDLNGRNLGTAVMETVLGWKDARILSITVQISQAMNFTLGGYNLKEQTALALRAEAWLVEMRGHSSKEEIARRRQVEELVSELISFLVEKREENYEVIKAARSERAISPIRESIRKKLLKEQPFEEILSELLQLEIRISEALRFLKGDPSLEVQALFEVHQQIPAFEKALDELIERRLDQGRDLSDEEKEWKEETENRLASLRRRSDFLWSTFCNSRVREIDSILSAQRELKIQGGVS